MVRFRSPGNDGCRPDAVRKGGPPVILALALAAMLAVSLPALSPSAAAQTAGAPVPTRKPEPPPVPGSRPPEALAVPAAPGLSAPVPGRPKGGVPPDGGPLAVGPAPDLASPPIPPLPPSPQERTAAASPPAAPDLGPSAEAPGIPAPPSMAALPLPPGLPEERVGMAPPPDPGPGPGTRPVDGREFTVTFDGGEDETLSPDDHALLSGIAARMARDQNARLELRSYASGNDEARREARRLSLMRAINVREFLVGQGVRGTRIDVRALGASAQAPAGRAADRVDLVLVN